MQMLGYIAVVVVVGKAKASQQSEMLEPDMLVSQRVVAPQPVQKQANFYNAFSLPQSVHGVELYGELRLLIFINCHLLFLTTLREQNDIQYIGKLHRTSFIIFIHDPANKGTAM